MKNKLFIGIFVLGIILTIINIALFIQTSKQAESKKADEISLGVLINSYNDFIESQNEVLLDQESDLKTTKNELKTTLEDFSLKNEQTLAEELVSKINELINIEAVTLEQLKLQNKEIKVIFNEIEIKLNES